MDKTDFFYEKYRKYKKKYISVKNGEILQSTGNKKQIAFLALDIETTGPNMITNWLNCLGYCLGDTKGNILEHGRFSMKGEKNQIFDKNTKKYFWNNNQKVLEIIEGEEKNQKPQIKKIC